MTAPQIPNGLLASLDVMVLEGDGDDTFRLVGEPPAWTHRLWPEAAARRQELHPQHAFLFLEHFLPEAAAVWEGRADGPVTSELWTEVDATGRQWLLEARALQLGERALLLLTFPVVAPERLREVLQQSRELNLEHYRLLKEIDRREVMLHCIVHDLSTPLASIKGSLRMLMDEALVDEEGQPLVQIGLRQVEKLRQMVGEMLAGAASAATHGQRLEGAAAPDLEAAVRELTASLAPAARLKDVRFGIETEPARRAAWPVVGEAARLERVLFNLLENALRHAPSGSEVRVRLIDEGPTVRACVEDAGEGVPESEIPCLFRKFSQGSGAAGQVGLGLYFSRITVEGWGGTVGYTHSPLGGACFWFRLPKPKVKRET